MCCGCGEELGLCLSRTNRSDTSPQEQGLEPPAPAKGWEPRSAGDHIGLVLLCARMGLEGGHPIPPCTQSRGDAAPASPTSIPGTHSTGPKHCLWCAHVFFTFLRLQIRKGSCQKTRYYYISLRVTHYISYLCREEYSKPQELKCLRKPTETTLDTEHHPQGQWAPAGGSEGPSWGERCWKAPLLLSAESCTGMGVEQDAKGEGK